MKNVTVTLNEAALEWARVKAARGNSSVSRMLGELIEDARRREGAYEKAMRAALKFETLPFTAGDRFLTREQANDRAGLR